MNIAFYTYNQCCPSIGGTERTTALISDSLKCRYGYKTYSIFSEPVDDNIPKHDFDNTLRIYPNKESDEHIIKFIKDNEIRVIINQGGFNFGIRVGNLIKDANINCIQIFALHFAPGSFEEKHISWEERKRIWMKKKSITETLKILVYPLYYSYYHIKNQQMYKLIENVVDKVVLLSPNYLDEWNIYSNKKNSETNSQKLIYIPNSASFNHYANEVEIQNKEKRILIVGRLDERQKKISKALRIWNNISKHSQMKDWSLDIVGSGPDQSYYKNLVLDEHISRVNFWGQQNPQLFYQRSSLFLMTSDFEGFSMTLVEASQYGVIPFALNTFSALSDIIINGKNGFVFDINDLDSYGNKIIQLATDESERCKVANAAVENAKRFSIDKITRMWHGLLSDLSQEK